MHRLFSTFAHGPPGAGLLLMRVVAGGALLAHAATTLTASPTVGTAVPAAIAAGLGILLVLGLWTPIAGALAALDAAWSALSNPGDGGFYVLLGALGAALALLGPGRWSIDARLFGWRRVDIGPQKRQGAPPF